MEAELQKKLNPMGWSEFRLPNKKYTLTAQQKARQLQVSESFLAQDRQRQTPTLDFARVGRLVRYAED